jgi:peptidoglycan-associated lipoprotein
MRLRRAAALALSGLLAACASHPKTAPGPASTPPPPPPAPPPSAAYAPPPVSGRILPGSAQDFVVNVGDRIYFDLDQYTVRQDALPVLTAQANWLARYPGVQVRIEGNCDERGTREYNLALGARRASSVREFLIAHGVAPSRIATISYGKERPIDPGAGDGAWARNRNAHTAIVSGAR